MTTYRLATQPDDYDTCRLFVPGKFGFPTILAERDGELLGFLGTHPRDDAVVVGPIFVREDKRGTGFIALRLIESYEKVLHAAGVSEYLLSADPEDEIILLGELLS